MADLTITAASVGIAAADTVTRLVQVGETVTQMQPVYLKASDKKYWLALNTAEASALAVGVTLTPAAADGYAIIATGGDVLVGATVVATEEYVVSDTAGKIMPLSDLTSAQYSTRLGHGISTTVIKLDVNATAIAKA